MKLVIPKGATSRILTVFIQNNSVATGAGLGSLNQSSSIVGGYVREGSTGVALAVDEDVTTEGTYQAPSTAAHVRIGTPANMRSGTYELHFHNDLWASGAEAVTITLGGATNMADIAIEVQLSDPVRGLGAPTALPNAAAGANGGLPTVNASNYVAGVQGTLNTLDALDTAQDTQHATTQGRLPAALVGGRMDASAGALAANVITAAAINDGAFTGAKFADGALTAAKFASGAFDAVWSVATRTLSNGAIVTATFADGAITAAKFAANAITSTVIADGAFTAAKAAAGFFDAVWSVTTRTLSSLSGVAGDIRAAVGLSAANLDTQLAAIQSRLPAALTAGGNMKSDALALNGDPVAAANIAKTTRAIGRGTVGGGATTTSIPTSAFLPNGAAADQFKGRIITFDADTATAALCGQSTDITASSNAATPTLTVTALTTAPASGDTFSVT